HGRFWPGLGDDGPLEHAHLAHVEVGDARVRGDRAVRRDGAEVVRAGDERDTPGGAAGVELEVDQALAEHVVLQRAGLARGADRRGHTVHSAGAGALGPITALVNAHDAAAGDARVALAG